jgi:prephenate dehydrogenase
VAALCILYILPPIMRPQTLGVIGLGAIGGSIARQAKRAGIEQVLGWSPDTAERAAAAREGALDDSPARAEDIARRADLLILAAPPAANLELLATLTPLLRHGALATDVSSVKRPIVERAAARGLGARFAGSHPLAGTHRRGFEASRAELFRGAVVYVTPVPDGEAAAREIVHCWQSVFEAQPVVIDAARHDAQVALASHLPQAVASLLGRVLADRLPPGASLGPGARDATRLAASEPGLWTEILLMNRDLLLPEVRALRGPLQELERALETGDAAALRGWLERGSTWRRAQDG